MRQFKNNMKHNISVTKTGYGHWLVITSHYRKKISCITTNSVAVDDYNSDVMEKDGRELRIKRGYTALRNECIRKNTNQ